MYAIIKTGGKQYRVAEGDRFKVETLSAEEDASYQFDNVLMVVDGDNTNIGTPYVDGAAVTATIVSHGRHKKIDIIKFRRRKHHQKRTGHRQNYTEIKITSIVSSGAKQSAAAPKKKESSRDAAAATKQSAAPAEQAQANDLLQLKGIGPVLEKKLQGLGIETLEQVANFTQEDIDKVDAELNFKGRIQRDNWVEQAKDLTKK